MLVAQFPACLQKAASAQDAAVGNISFVPPSGDRVRSSLGSGAASLDAAISASATLSPDYRIGAGDVLKVDVRGKVDLGYGRTSDAQNSAADNTYEVTPSGQVHLPLIEPIDAVGKTTSELQKTIYEKLSAYYKNFTVDVSVVSPGTIKVWVSGQVANPGPQALPSSATILEVLLRADILPTGSTRLVELTRNGKTMSVDVYSIVARGELESNIKLEANDKIYVPAVVDWVKVEGEVCRSGQFELVKPEGSDFHVNDLVGLCLGLLPSASRSNVTIERVMPDGKLTAIHVDLSGSDNPQMLPGDKLVVPSVTDYQPTIRLVGEFKGEGVYQRVADTVLNKSGVYRFASGETAGDVIARTGGTTPQADLMHAKIERRSNGKLITIPLDLDRLITHQDKSADVALESGDTVILPALMNKVYVFGQVVTPGAISYEPDRRLLDYLGAAGGLGSRAKSSLMVIRGDPDSPEVLKVNALQGMKGRKEDNPILEPGDVVYVPEGVITDWRDVAQIISTIRLLTLF